MDELFQNIQDDIASSAKTVKVLPCDDAVKEKIGKAYQINPQSLLGTLLAHTGGIIIDNWIRIYGAGELDFAARNALVPFDNIVLAEDILGGLFVALDNGSMGYFAPDCLEFEDMEIRFSQFFSWCLHGDTDLFYSNCRWKNWQKDTAEISCQEGVAFFPFLWSDAENLESRTRKILPIEEIIRLELDLFNQLQEKID